MDNAIFSMGNLIVCIDHMGLGRKPHNAHVARIISSTVVIKLQLARRWDAQVGPPAFLFVNAVISSSICSGT